MPVNPLTGQFERISNSFSNPVNLTVVDAPAARALFDDYDAGINYILSFVVVADVVPDTSGAVDVTDTQGAAIIKKIAPTATAVNLPSIADRDGKPLLLADISTGISEETGHVITVNADGSDTFMGLASPFMTTNYGSGVLITFIPYLAENTWLVRV